MPYRPREIVIRAREAAATLLAALDRNEMVARFLDMYAAEFRRPGRADHPVLYREQLQTIRREAILAMVLRMESSLPRRLKVKVTVGARSRRPKRAHKGAKPKRPARTSIKLGIPFLDLFREEFFVALGQWLEWSEQDASEFWRDMEFYEQLSATAPRGAASGARSGKPAISGPFVDRVAMLLDPSLMDQARREAARFQTELSAVADRVLQKAFSRRAS